MTNVTTHRATQRSHLPLFILFFGYAVILISDLAWRETIALIRISWFCTDVKIDRDRNSSTKI